MRYTIPIVPEVTQESVLLLWSRSMTKHNEQVKSRFVIGIVSVIVGLLVHEHILKAILFTSAFFMLLTAIYYTLQFKKGKKTLLEETAKKYDEPGEMIIELTDDHFYYFDKYAETKIAWAMFDDHFIYGNLLYITFKLGTGYMINRKLLSQADFDEIVTFLKSKKPAH